MVWGLFYFVLLLLEKFTHLPEKLGRGAHVYAMVAVILGWVMFRSASLEAGIHYIGMMFGIGSMGITDAYFWLYIRQTASVLIAGVIFSLPVVPWLKSHGGKFIADWEPFAAMGLFLLTLVVTVSASYNPFIYFNF